MRNSTQSFIDRPISTFIVITTPEILLTCLNINNNSWIKFDSHWYYKIEKKQLNLPFQRQIYITNEIKNIFMTPREKNFYDFPEKKISSRKLKLADKIVRKILNLNTSTPIEDYTEKSQKIDQS